jgi:hypothetical protein
MHVTTERLYAAMNELLEVRGQSAIGMEYFDAGHRKRRLADLAAAKGGPQKLGKLLGYADGSYVGQMISGNRPITEKTVAKIHGMRGLAGWFYTPHASSTAHQVAEPTQKYVPQTLSERLIFALAEKKGGTHTLTNPFFDSCKDRRSKMNFLAK